ncbi:MAG: hypothetical protein KJO82_02415 [Gammaproteobacteria bacterium]|nr:hypothetical protein [Gammaproteobacteria bacterium]
MQFDNYLPRSSHTFKSSRSGRRHRFRGPRQDDGDSEQLAGNDYLPALTGAGINLGGEEPPQLISNGGFDSRMHDPRGRRVYVRAVLSFD